MGAYATMNEGLLAARGELLTVICADDKYACSRAISSAVNRFQADQRCDVVYGETLVIGEEGALLEFEGPRSGPVWMFRYYPVVAHCSLFIKREMVIEAGLLFDVSFAYSADYDWIMRMIGAKYAFRRLRQPVAMFRRHPMQRSGYVSPERAKEVERLRFRYGEGNPVLRSVVRQWVRLTMLSNLARRKGISACAHEIRSRIRTRAKR